MGTRTVAALVAVLFGFFAVAPLPAGAQWEDDMEGYADGSVLDGQGGWHGWDGNDTPFSVVSSNQAESGLQSVMVGAGADSVHELDGYTTGKWALRTELYVPSSFVGKTYFIVMNAYDDGGPYEWGAQIGFDGDSGDVECNCGSGTQTTVPLVLDQWAEVRLEIDLDGDFVDVYYDGAWIEGYAWSTGPFGGGNYQVLGIEAVDLYPDVGGHPHVSELYFDSFGLHHYSGPVGTAYCFGDGSGTPCPCGNPGGAGEGCANSTGAGATLSATGSTSAGFDDMVCGAVGLLPGQPALLFAGLNAVNNGDGVLFGDGLRCAGGGVVRLGVGIPDAGGAAAWGPGLGALGGWADGDVRRLQVWYRDPSGSPCGNGFNLSNGLEVTFTP